MYCFGIFLPRFRERHAYLTRHLAAVWGPHCEITGYEGPVPDPNAPFQPDLTAGQIGCALSHMSALRADDRARPAPRPHRRG